MIKNEWKFIGRNKLILLSVIVMTIIPFLYSIFFLKSVWDPYGDTKELPIAVVNEDQPVKYAGHTLNVGNQTIDKLKNNKQLGWRFVSKTRARQGLKDKEYYTIITIPKDFSKNATTVLSKHPKKMELKYETNDSLNYIGEVISGIGVSSLDKQIRTAVTNAYASAMFEALKIVGKGMDKAAKGANQLDGGTVTLNDGLNQYTAAVSQVNNGVQTLNVKVTPMVNGLNQLQQSTAPLATGIGQLYNGSGQLSSGLQQLQQAVAASNSGDQQALLQQLTAALPQINAGLQQLNSQLQGQQFDFSAINGLKNQLGNVGTQATTIGDNLTQAGQTLQSLQNSGSQTMDTQAMTSQMMQAINENLGADNQLTPQQQAVVQGVVAQSLNQASDQGKQQTAQVQTALASVGKNIQAAGTADAQIGETLTNVQKQTANLNLNSIQGQLQQLQGAVAQLSQASNVALPGATSAITQLSGGVSSIQGALNGTSTQPGLVGGASQLTSSLGQLNAAVPTLTGGINQLAAGGSQLTGGINQLAAGTAQLDSKSGDLLAGSQKLNQGTNQLSQSLTDGAQTVNGIKISPKNLAMFAAPTKQKHTSYSHVPNYGHALAPYVLSVALYVGCIVFNFAYPIRKVSEAGKSATAWFWSKVVVGTVVAIAMGVLEASLIMVGGLTVDHVGQFYLTAISFALCSMFIIMFLSMALDNPGRFIAMVLLMLQLGGSGGTFPMEVTNHFFNVIHPYLPMTYSILSFRQAITSGLGTSTVTSSIAILLLTTLGSLILLWITMQVLQKIHLMGVSQLDDNQKLQEVAE